MAPTIRFRAVGAPLLLLLSIARWASGQAPAAGNDPNDYVNYGSRESTGLAPSLVVEREDGTHETISAIADALLIGYLPERPFGSLPFLAVNLCSSNRVLVRFGPVQGPLRKAEIVLRVIPPGAANASPSLPSAPFEIGAYPVREAWDEHRVIWSTQPAGADEPSSTVQTRPDAAELRLDVTASAGLLADPIAAARGWLVQVAHPMPWDGPEPGAGGAIEQELLRLFAWAESVPQAIRRARAEKKLVLVCVRSHPQADKTSFFEQVLLAAVLADPDVLALVSRRFVPVRVNIHPAAYTMETEMPGAADPFAELGTSLKDEKATALVVSDGARRIASLTNIGTFDRDLVLRLLLEAIDRAGDSTTDGHGDGWSLLSAGRPADARRAFARMGGREGDYGLARAASLLGDYDTALRHALPLTKADGPFRNEAEAEAGRALLRLGRPAEAAPLLRAAAASERTGATAAYELGCALLRIGEPEQARAIWRDTVSRFKGTASAARSQARLAWPEALAMYENLTALDRGARSAAARGTREGDRLSGEDRAVRRAVDYLLGSQDLEGTWSSASQAGKYRVAITALVARSLHLWGNLLNDDRGARAIKATERSTAWLTRELGQLDPARMDSFGAAYVLDYFLDLEEAKAASRGNVPAAIRLLLAGQCPTGGWSYDYQFAVRWAKDRDPQTFPARTHSMNTGLALLALARARARGHEVDAKALEIGRKALLAMRERPGVYTYIYPGPKNFNTPESSAARGAICEHALAVLGAVPDQDIDAAVDQFMKFRDELRLPVKVWGPTWLPPRAYTSYFYFFAYDHAARAIAYRGDHVTEKLGSLRDDVLGVAEVDGTWLDFEPIGKPYGTAMALHVLYLARRAGAAAAAPIATPP
jgi:hypothetical protein